MANNNIAQLLSLALALHRAGNIDDAELHYRQVLLLEATHARALGMLGMVQLQRGKMDAGIMLLMDSLMAQPDQPDVLNNLGNALHMQGRYDEALVYLDRAIACNPTYDNAHYNRGNVLHDMARYSEALTSFVQVIKLNPEHVGAHINRGNALKELHRMDEALASYDKAISFAPYYPEGHCNRGNVLQALNRYDEALASYGQAIRIKPDFVEAYYHHGLVLYALKHNEKALASLDRAIGIRPDYAEAHYSRGLVLLELMRYDEALASLDRAIRIKPDFAEAHAKRGWHLIERGEKEAAESSLNAAFELDSSNVTAITGFAEIITLSEDDPRFKQISALYDLPDAISTDEQIALSFAMGKTLERLERYDDAFGAYEKGNRLYHLNHPVAEADADEVLEWVSSFFNSNLFDNYAKASDALPPVTDGRTPIFIFGMPRSGSTLVEQILSSHPQVYGAGELTDIGSIIREVKDIPHSASDFTISLSRMREMGMEYLDRISKRAPEARYMTDKLPGNFRYLGLIHLMLPHAKFVHTMRDPMDCCFSCFALHFADPLDYTYDLGTLGRYFLRYQKYMEHWRSVLPPGRILDVGYEDIVADPEGQTRRLLDYLELPWHSACLNFHDNKRVVQTASLSQVRKPIYSSSVARWKRFEKHLGPLIKIIRAADWPQ